MLGRLLRGATLGTITLVLAGCGAGIVPALTPLPQPIVDCLAVPAERCADALAAAHADAATAGTIPTRVRMTCSQPACTVAGGRAQVDAWFGDGTVANWGAEWSGALQIPPSLPADEAILTVNPACLGVDPVRCREMAKGIIVPVGQTGRVVAITVTCTVPSCGPTEGEGTTQVTYEDGTTESADWAYAGG
jgi:hypothetical protein